MTLSDEQGCFRLWGKSHDNWVRVVAEGYRETTTKGDSSDGPFEFVLLPESVIVGIVVDTQTGEPVEGLRGCR